MKTFGIAAIGLLIPAALLADTISSTGGFVSVPANFGATTGSGSIPFWNNNSLDIGGNLNAGYFLTGTGSAGSTNYLSTGGGFGNYLSIGGLGPDASLNFNLIQSSLTADVTLLYTNAGANMTTTYGTQIGLYDVQNPNQKVVLFDHGTLYNPNAPGGVYNNNLSPQTPFTVNTFAGYGIYANTCGFNPNGTIYCDTYYSNSALNQTTGPARQHFALFENAQDPLTYFIAFEDSRGFNATEGYGDFNDVIFRLQTSQAPPPPPTITITEITPVPEPATFSILGIGLVGLGLLRRSRSRRPEKS